MASISAAAAADQPQVDPSSPAAAWRHATGLAVVLKRGTSSAKDVVGLGWAWVAGVELWLETSLPYLILTATAREGLHSPGAIMARDIDALRFAVSVVCDRASELNLLWANCADVATWQIVAAVIAERMPTEGNA